MSVCRLCDKPRDPSRHYPDICTYCFSNLGLAPRTPPLRPPGPCVSCGHDEILRMHLRDRSASPGDMGSERVRPLAAVVLPRPDTRVFSGKAFHDTAPDKTTDLGRFEVYACRRCGASELFTADVADFPIGPEFGTELLVVSGDGPYR